MVDGVECCAPLPDALPAAGKNAKLPVGRAILELIVDCAWNDRTILTASLASASNTEVPNFAYFDRSADGKAVIWGKYVRLGDSKRGFKPAVFWAS